MEQYHTLLKKVLGDGEVQFEPRTQEYLLGSTSLHSDYDLRNGFPLVTTKNVPPRLPFEELFWKLRGERNVKSLFDRDVHIWDANGFDMHLKRNNLKDKTPKHTETWNKEFENYKERLRTDSEFAATAGDLGPVYGYQWRHGFKRGEKDFDQLVSLISSIKEKPGSRYHVLNAWNPSELPNMALGPCPFWHQFTVYGENLDLSMVQRSCDVFLGVPFNIAQDSLLLSMIAKETGLKPRKFSHTYLNVHSYLGVPPRSDFWKSSDNVKEFQEIFKGITNREDYLNLREWYINNAGNEGMGNERKDHIPFILEQLSKQPVSLPKIELADIPLLDAIQKPVGEVVKVIGYNPLKWDAKAIMAA